MKFEFPFTKARIEAIQPAPPKKRPYYWDTDQPRLCVRVTDKGAKTFYYVHRHPQGVDLIKLGTFPAMTVDTARKAARKTAAGLDLGENPAEVRRQLRGEPTLRDLFNDYTKHLKANKRKSTAEVRAMFELYLGELPDAPPKPRGRKRTKPAEGVNWESRKASKITVADVQALHKRIGEAGKTTTANRVVEVVSAIYGTSKDATIRAMNPAKGVESYSEAQRDRHLTSEEAGRFVEALKAEPLDWQDFFLMLLLTGQRLMNVASMRWRDVDLEAATWVLSATQTKQGKPITIALTDQAASILRRRKKAAEEGATFVFPANSATGHVTRPQRRWEALTARAKLEDVRKHDLRHTAASWLAQRGASLAIIGAALGHRDIKSTMRYSHMILDPVRKALQSAHNEALGGEPATKVAARIVRLKPRRAAR